MDKHDILLVEDNEDDIELTLHAFQKSRVANKIVVLCDGESAVDHLFGRDSASPMPALILLDLKLPGINGLEVLRRIRSEEATRRIPVVILTTSDDETDIVNGYNLGVNSYIRKPVGFAAFSTVVDQLGLYWLVTNTPPP